MSNVVVIPELIKNVVAMALVEYQKTIPAATLGYHYGPVDEVTETLVQMSYDPVVNATKFPLIALFTDITEKRGQDTGQWAEATLNIIIATLTDGNYKAAERTSVSFQAVLYPIYECFLKAIVKSHYFNVDHVDFVVHNKIDRYNWGRKSLTIDGQPSSDFIDAIELQNLVLKVNSNYCKTLFNP